ncbi:CHASE3 domain-containing protein [Paraflavitalea speifideaquila]|uniref:CHASE3 domain-containing protein n=1 Tax=Paraflavitalea speifideaquila TaxID=3076558 RepID=UPI0028F0F7B5|nr:CHASE3 domain-containing protein [Paraflavitalea speifideiaquila]
MKFRFQYIYSLFILSFGILTIFSLLFYKRLMESTQASNEVEHNYETMFLLSQVDSYLKDGINSELGFVLTGDSTLLYPALTQVARIPDILASIRASKHTSNNLKINLVKLQGLIAERIRQLKDNISEAAKGLDKENLTFRLLQAKVVMADYQQLYEKIQGIEAQTKVERDSRKEQGQRITPNFLYATFIFAAACLILSFFFIIRELKKTGIPASIATTGGQP